MRAATGIVSLAIMFTFALFLSAIASGQSNSNEQVRLIVDESEKRVDISIGGKPFTAYIWPSDLAKPVLYPLRAADGTIVTRGFPLDPRPGERIDHPHHVGMWFNYGNVNDIDFWNNSAAIKPADAPKMGTIQQRKILSAKSGATQGDLEVETDWLTADHRILLKEHTQFIFRGGPKFRSIDRITTLQAQDEKVIFHDDKEGLLGIRVRRELETPSDKPEVYTDATGRVTTMAKLDNAGVNGVYLTSEGKKGDAVWGTRGHWCNLSGLINGEPVTITILDHPANPGFPTFWHARGYGLFAANPLGQKIFTDGKEELNFTLGPKESVMFRYRVLISSEISTTDQTEAAYKSFISAVH
jgi:Methane oxygenase PmoA